MICMRELATIGVATIRYKSVDKDTNRKRECYTIGTYDQRHYSDHFHGGDSDSRKKYRSIFRADTIKDLY